MYMYNYQYFIQITGVRPFVCLSVHHGCDALPICGPISACIVSARVTWPHFRVIASAFNEY